LSHPGFNEIVKQILLKVALKTITLTRLKNSTLISKNLPLCYKLAKIFHKNVHVPIPWHLLHTDEIISLAQTSGEKVLRLAAILEILFVSTFIATVILYMSSLNICIPIENISEQFTDKFQYQSQVVDTDNSTLWDQRAKCPHYQ
jgi:hypothetical protein